MEFSRKKYQDTLREEIQHSDKKIWLITGAEWVWKKTFLRNFHARLHGENIPSVLIETQDPQSLESIFTDKWEEIRDAYIHILVPYDDALERIMQWYEGNKELVRGIFTTSRVYFGQFTEVSEFPLTGISWREYRDEIELSWTDSSDAFAGIPEPSLESIYDDYVLSGAYPAVLTLDRREARTEMQRVIFEKKCTEMVQQLYTKDEPLFRNFLRVLATETGSLLKWDYFARLAGIPRRKVATFLEILEEFGVIERILPFVRHEALETWLHDRFYWSDLSFMRVLLSDLYLQGAMRIRVLENFLYLELKALLSHDHTLWFYRKKSQATIPFILSETASDMIIPITILERDTFAIPQVFRSFHELYGPSVKRYMVFTHTLSDTRKIGETEILYKKCTDM